MAEHEDFAIAVGQLGDGHAHTATGFFTDRPLAGAVGAIEESVGQQEGRFIGQVAHSHFFALHGALAGADVAAMHFDESIPRELPQPGIERHWPATQIVGEFAVGVGQDVLHDVGGVHARRESAVHAHGDHAPQPFAVAGEQLLTSRVVAAAGTAEQRVGIDFRTGHQWIPPG
jgi:hypothetical protein